MLLHLELILDKIRRYQNADKAAKTVDNCKTQELWDTLGDFLGQCCLFYEDSIC